MRSILLVDGIDLLHRGFASTLSHSRREKSPSQFYCSTLFNSSFSANNSSLERVIPLPIFSRSFQALPRLPQTRNQALKCLFEEFISDLGEVPEAVGVFAQPDGDLERMPTCLMISYLISDIVPVSSKSMFVYYLPATAIILPRLPGAFGPRAHVAPRRSVSG